MLGLVSCPKEGDHNTESHSVRASVRVSFQYVEPWFSLNLLWTFYVLGSQMIYGNRILFLAAGTKLYSYVTENNKMVTWRFILGSKRGSDNHLTKIAARITKFCAKTDYQVRSNYEQFTCTDMRTMQNLRLEIA